MTQAKHPPTETKARRRSDALLQWYDANRRELPWRAAPGTRPDPYHVWLSEIMLQQTTVATVTGYFDRFVTRWPNVTSLARAGLDEVLHQWQGLGYYARARNLHRCAQAIMQHHHGQFPTTEEGLRTLPGIGDYTAAAIAAIAFDQPALPVDGNIERVTARLFAITEPLPAPKIKIRQQARQLLPHHRYGDVAQAYMDLGATICIPRQPSCNLCPIASFCEGFHRDIAATLPARTPKRQRPQKFGIVFWIENAQGQVLIRRRAENGLLGGLMEFPSTDWIESAPEPTDARTLLPSSATMVLTEAAIDHVFTHFSLRLTLAKVSVTGDDILSSFDEALWVHPRDLHHHALPTLMRKVILHAVENASL